MAVLASRVSALHSLALTSRVVSSRWSPCQQIYGQKLPLLCRGYRSRLPSRPCSVTALLNNLEANPATTLATVPISDWTQLLASASQHITDSSINIAATIASEGPIELPPSEGGLPEYLLDPWAIPEATPLQSFASVLLTGTIAVLLYRSLKRRASSVKDQRFRSDSVEKISPYGSTADVDKKAKQAQAAGEAAKRPPPSVLSTLGGALMAGSITIILYRFATSVDDIFAVQNVSTTNYTVRNLSVAVRTIVSGLVWLATFVFGANALGLTLYSGQLALGLDDNNDDKTAPITNAETDGGGDVKKEESPKGFGSSSSASQDKEK